jgi:ammonia channel protein AmtB
MTSPEQRAIDFAGGTVIHINWPFIFFALLVALSVVVIFAVRKK